MRARPPSGRHRRVRTPAAGRSRAGVRLAVRVVAAVATVVVVGLAATSAQAAPQVARRTFVTVDAAPAALAITTALAQVGLPYLWGGNDPGTGFDCSGLVRFAYAAAGVTLPRTAHAQYYRGPFVPAGMPLQAGDLVFYGVPAYVHHVGLYLGDGRMVNAPDVGRAVQVSSYRWPGDDYLGATRPTGSVADGLLPGGPAPVPVPPAVLSHVFAAPQAVLDDVLMTSYLTS